MNTTRVHCSFHVILCVAAVAMLGGTLVDAARASDVLGPEDDWWFTLDDGETHDDFSDEPIPADFFGPGSDPFGGVITYWHGPSSARKDTVIRRLGAATLPFPPESSDTINIRLIDVQLHSRQAIRVTYNGGATEKFFDVMVTPSSSPQPEGTMTITHSSEEGGTYDATLPVLPRLTFTQTDDPGTQFILDFGEVARDPLLLAGANHPWCHAPVPDDGSDPLPPGNTFYGGYLDCGIKVSVRLSGPDSAVLCGLRDAWTHATSNATTIVEPIPTVSDWGLIVMTVLALTAGTILYGQRRRPAAA
ncbi:MAG: hypothetical protein IH987_04445 [Planctomycetes bacterium]|nr:hypothetical protein [Planctomycetota bacterium]